METWNSFSQHKYLIELRFLSLYYNISFNLWDLGIPFVFIAQYIIVEKVEIKFDSKMRVVIARI